VDSATGLPDLLEPRLRAVFAGVAVQCRPIHRHYYGGPGNQFWRLLHDSGLTRVLLTPEDDELLPSYGYGLTDLARTRDRDEYLLEDFEAKIGKYRPAVVAFTSKTAAACYARAAGRKVPKGYGAAPWSVRDVDAFVLPGPSGANNGMPLPVRTALWRDLTDHLRVVEESRPDQQDS
jgi:TDG/mug DNA glycosylase family protein